MKKTELEQLLGILTEECSEVIKAESKMDRFGSDTVYEGITNREHFEQEVGDVLATIMVISLRYPRFLTSEGIEKALAGKVVKLKKYIPSLHDFDLDKAIEESELGT